MMATTPSTEEELEALFQRERQHVLPTGFLAAVYRAAVGGEGCKAGEWADKPHRLVYDLLRVVDTYREQIKNQDGDFAVRLMQFRKKLDEAGLHGHYSIFQECFGADIDGTYSTFPKPQEPNVSNRVKPGSPRDVVYTFLRFPFHTQLEIIQKVGYTVPMSPEDDNSIAYFTKAVAAIREAGKMDDFRAAVQSEKEQRTAQGWD
jgi:hypothetical protein